MPRERRKAEVRNRALHVLARTRRGESLSKAARAEHVKPVTVLKYLGGQFHQDAPGKPWKATKSDRLTAYMSVLTDRGRMTARARGYRERLLASRHNILIARWRRGEPDVDAELAALEGQTVGGLRLLTDAKLLASLEDVDELGFDELYMSLAGDS